MPPCKWLFASGVVALMGCGSEVTVIGGDGESPPADEVPAPEIPTPEPPGPEPPEGGDVCGAHQGAVEVSLSAGCDYGEGILEIESVEPVPGARRPAYRR